MYPGSLRQNPDVQTQRNYRSRYGRDPPSRPSIRLWHKKFMRQGQCSIQGVGDQEQLKKWCPYRSVLNRVMIFFIKCLESVLNVLIKTL